MKKLFFLFIIIFLLPTPNVALAKENHDYYRVITDTTPFYSDNTGESLMFYLPYTYYVKVLDVEGDFAHIECYGFGDTVKVDGYTYFDMLYKDGLSVNNPYVNQKIKTNKTAVLYSDKDLITPLQFVFAERNLNYYGHLIAKTGERIYCVGYTDVIGYVKESDVHPFLIENHPNELTFIQQEPDAEINVKSPKNTTVSTFRIIIISCLLLAGIIAVVISLKKKKPPELSGDYYEESDYE